MIAAENEIAIPARPEAVGDSTGQRSKEKQRYGPEGDEKGGLRGVQRKLSLPRRKDGDDERIAQEIDKEGKHEGEKGALMGLRRIAHSSSSTAGRASRTSMAMRLASSTWVSNVKSESAPGR